MTSLMQEYLALCRQLAKVQERCSAALAEQTARAERLERENLRLRARLVRQVTQQAWALEDAAVPPGLPRRKEMARRIAELIEQVRRLTRERMRWHMGVAAPGQGAASVSLPTAQQAADQAVAQAAAEWVICQTGCISHDAYWRVQDHCRRTGRACLLVESPQAASLGGQGVALPAVVEVRVQRVLKVDS